MTYLGKEVRNGKLTVVSHFGIRHEYNSSICSACQDVAELKKGFYVCEACYTERMASLRDSKEVRELLHGKA